MQLSKKIEGKKFMWDGVEYPQEQEAENAGGKYKSAGFETAVIQEESRFYIFTRKVVTEVIVEGAPPL
jgi:hypothetical protein